MILTKQDEIEHLIKQNYKKILLVESVRLKYVPLGLLKLWTYYKNEHVHVLNFRCGKYKFEFIDYDIIFINTGEFSYYHNEILNVVGFFRREHPNTPIIIGGVYAITSEPLRKILSEQFGCTVIACNIDFLDKLHVIDYSLFKWNPWNFVFTTRGCKMNCKFCYVKDIEPDAIIFDNEVWENQIIHGIPPYVMIHDNNIISYGIKHFKKVVDVLLKTKKMVLFNGGFDVRFWNEEFNQEVKKLSDAKLFGFSSIRFAFDSMNQNKRVQKALQMVSKYHDPSEILVYILVNFTSDLENCLYRANEIVKLGAYPFVQWYTPLTHTSDPKLYHGPQYVPELHYVHDYYNNKVYKTTSYEDYKKYRETIK